MVEHIDFTPSFNDTGIPTVRAFADASRKGEGTVRYDIYQEPPAAREPLLGRGSVDQPASL
jgi:quinol monooxygenase YgiN